MQGIFFNPPIENNYLGHIMAEVYKDKIYDQFLVGRKDLVIIDIGANVGVTSYYFSQFAKVVYSIEPSQEHFEVLNHMIKYNELGTIIRPFKYAVYLETGKFPLFHNINKTMFSLHMAVNDNSSPPEEVETISLDKFFTNQNIEHVDLMKLDVEGSEVEILSGHGFKSVASKIDIIILEVHSWNGRHPNQIKEALRDVGFIVDAIQNDATILVAKR